MQFNKLLDKIIRFSGDAVISLSLWGDVSLHPERLKLIKSVLAKRELSLIIETSGIGWPASELEEIAQMAKQAPERITPFLPPPVSWIVSLDTNDASRYKEIRGSGFSEAVQNAKKLLELFPNNAYVQAIRINGFEDDIEKFYRYWKDTLPPSASGKNTADHVIIQKYDDFCGKLPKLQASDLSPVIRNPCWHIIRDMVITLDGSVPLCREDINVLQDKSLCLGNVFEQPLEEIWERGKQKYMEHAQKIYSGLCSGCDEFYTFNF